MGYNTNFTLSYEFSGQDSDLTAFEEECQDKGVEIPESLKIRSSQSEEALEEILDSKDFCNYSPLMDFVQGNADRCKWYDWKKDMIRLSEQFPSSLFILEGEGEEAEDIWKAYFKGGKCQIEKAKIKFDEFDPEKLT